MYMHGAIKIVIQVVVLLWHVCHWQASARMRQGHTYDYVSTYVVCGTRRGISIAATVAAAGQ